MHRIRCAMQDGSLLKVGGNGGEVEVDETKEGIIAVTYCCLRLGRHVADWIGTDYISPDMSASVY